MSRSKKIDINRILRDIRDVQKEINQWQETLKRSYAAADEVVYASAKKDPELKTAYKTVVELHTDFAQLVERVELKGKATAESRQLELKSDAVGAQNHSLNFDKVANDLKQVKAENEKLVTKLKQQATSQ